MNLNEEVEEFTSRWIQTLVNDVPCLFEAKNLRYCLFTFSFEHRDVLLV